MQVLQVHRESEKALKRELRQNKVPFFLVQIVLRDDCFLKEILVTVCWISVIVCGDMRLLGIVFVVTSDD